MELKPEHLKIFPFYEDHKVPGLLVQLGEDIVFPVSRINLEFVIKNQYKPLLRPISELKKKIISEKGLPENLQSELASLTTSEDCKLLKESTKALLAKNLFDIDGLIEAGLALPYSFELKRYPQSFWILD